MTALKFVHSFTMALLAAHIVMALLIIFVHTVHES